MPSSPDTIVLIHGLWVTPRSWEHWKAHYAAKGYRVLTPAYPGLEVEVEALNADPSPIEELTVNSILEHLTETIGRLETQPILIGHSAGGFFTQLLLDRGYGAVGVTISSAPPEGVKVVPLSQVKSTLPVLKNPANRHRAVPFTPEQWHYAFGNALPEERSLELYERYAIPAPGNLVWGSVLANLQPGHQETYVDFDNQSRAPLLFISGSEDNIMPPKVQRSNAKHYKGETITELKEYAGRGHAIVAEDGWEEIADYALEWAESNSRKRTTPGSPA